MQAKYFEFDEPAVNNVGTEVKYCELCNGSKDHNTWECKKFDSCNIPKDERRKMKQCRIRFHKELVHSRKELGLPPPPKPTTSIPPKERPLLPRDAILPGDLPPSATSTVSTSLPDELPQPHVTVISDEQKQALNCSSVSDIALEPDPAPTLAYDMNAENLTALQDLIKNSVHADDQDVCKPARYDHPFTARNSVGAERNTFTPIDNNSGDDFDQSHFDTYGGGSLKNF